MLHLPAKPDATYTQSCACHENATIRTGPPARTHLFLFLFPFLFPYPCLAYPFRSPRVAVTYPFLSPGYSSLSLANLSLSCPVALPLPIPSFPEVCSETVFENILILLYAVRIAVGGLGLGLPTNASFQSPPQNHPLPLRFLCNGMVLSPRFLEAAKKGFGHIGGRLRHTWQAVSRSHQDQAYELKGVGGLLHELHLPIGSPRLRDLLIAKHLPAHPSTPT